MQFPIVGRAIVRGTSGATWSRRVVLETTRMPGGFCDAARMAVAQTTERSTSERRTLSIFKSDRPRAIDRFIDYFGSDGSGHGRTPSRFPDQSVSGKRRPA